MPERFRMRAESSSWVIFHFPAIEVRSLLVIVIEYLREDFLVGGVAECFGGGTNPAVRFDFLRQIGQCGVRFAVSLLGKIGVFDVFPAVLELLESTAAAFGETGVANLTIRCQYLAAGSEMACFTISVEARVMPGSVDNGRRRIHRNVCGLLGRTSESALRRSA